MSGPAELLEGELPEARARLREGVDFTEAHEAADLLMGTEAEVVRVPGWALLTLGVIRELRMHEATGHLPAGRAYARQPAWKVELWEAYWQGKGARQG
jgi:hypothetical protein